MTDRQTDARGKTICLPTLAGGGRHNNLKIKISHWSKWYIFEKYKCDVHRFSSDVHQFLSRENVPVFATNL